MAYGRSCGKCGATRIDSQIGLEATLDEFIATLVAVFRDVRRVLRDDGTLWLNIGDSYAGSWGNYGGQNRGNGTQRTITNGSQLPQKAYDGLEQWRPPGSYPQAGLKPKDLMLVPFRLALALQADGWWVRSDIIWAKRAPMPESVTDRPTSAHEHIFLLTKRPKYFYDADAVREEGSDTAHGGTPEAARLANGGTSGHRTSGSWAPGASATLGGVAGANGRNQRNVWHLGPEPFPEAHFATFPTEIPRRAIKAGTSERGCCAACGAPWVRQVERTGETYREKGNRVGFNGYAAAYDNPQGLHHADHRGESDRLPVTVGWSASCSCEAGLVPCVVLDPFLGSGTTLLVADQLGRDGIGIELNGEYAAMAERRIKGDAPMFAAVEVG